MQEEIKRSAATVEDVRLVYGSEAPLAFRIAVARVGADELRRAARATRPYGAAAEVEAVVQEELAFTLSTGEKGTGSLADGLHYRTDDGGFDVGRRLADVRAQQPDLVGLDPDATQAEADERGRAGRTVMVSIPILVLAYLVIALAWWARRRGARSATVAAADPGLIPQPWWASRGRRDATIVALLAWLLITLLAGPQLQAADEAQQSQSLATRKAALISTSIAASSIRAGFVADSRRAYLAVDISVNARELGALDAPVEQLARSERVIAAADRAAVPRVHAIAATMGRLPGVRHGVDAATSAAIATTPADWTALLVEQNRQADLADDASRRSDRLVVALLLGGLASSLAAIAAVPARTPAFLLFAPVALLVGGLTVALSGLLL